MHLLICFKKTQHGSCRLSVIRFAYYFEYSRSFEMRSNLLNQAVLEMVASFSFDWDVNKTWLVNTNGSRSHSILSAPPLDAHLGQWSLVLPGSLVIILTAGLYTMSWFFSISPHVVITLGLRNLICCIAQASLTIVTQAGYLSKWIDNYW